MLSFAVALCYYQDSRSLAGRTQSTPTGRSFGRSVASVAKNATPAAERNAPSNQRFSWRVARTRPPYRLETWDQMWDRSANHIRTACRFNGVASPFGAPCRFG
jgi:hypothetical protein